MLDYIRRNSHAGQVIHKSELMGRFNIHYESELRAMIRELRLSGCPIGNDGYGYFWAKNVKELQPTIDRHYGKAMKELETWRALKGIDFGQQGRLEL